jgi:hypothetical protein
LRDEVHVQDVDTFTFHLGSMQMLRDEVHVQDVDTFTFHLGSMQMDFGF